MKHKEFKPHAAITLSNCGGIEIMVNHSQDGLYYRFNYGQDNLDTDEIFEAEIQYDQEGGAYFLHEYKDTHTTYYLNEAMKTNL